MCCHVHARVSVAVALRAQGDREASTSILIRASLGDDAHGTQVLQDASFLISAEFLEDNGGSFKQRTNKFCVGTGSLCQRRCGLGLVIFGEELEETKIHGSFQTGI